MQKQLIKFFLILLFSFCSTFVYSDVAFDKLVMDLNSWLNSNEKIKINFSESKYSRNTIKKRKLEAYKSTVSSFRVLIAQMFLANLWGNKPQEKSEFSERSPIKVQQFYESLKSFNETGGNFKTGDIFFFLSSSPNSSQIAKLIHSDYSHAGMIWLKENKEIYLVHVDPAMDLQIVRLFDYITAAFPKIVNMGVYRSVQSIDEKDAGYFFRVLEDNKDTILFDPYFVNNPGIKIPEKYFKQYPHFYCTELIYLFYSYILGTKDILTLNHLSSKAMIKNYVTCSSDVDALLDKIDAIDNKNKQYIIHPNNFIDSKFFKHIYSIKQSLKNEQRYK